MTPTATPRRALAAATLLAALASTAASQEASKAESNYVKLLKKAPEARIGQIVEIIGRRGDAADLAYIFHRAADPSGFPASARLKALELLADAALTRNLRPEFDPADLARLLDAGVEAPSRLAAIRLAGIWKAEATVPGLAAIALSRDVDGPGRAAALDAMAAVGGKPARDAIEALASAREEPEVRASAVAALARIDIDAAADRAAGVVADATGGLDLAPLMAAFLDRRGGAEKLASALAGRKPPADAAKLALRAVYALGRADEALVSELSRAAGLDAEARLPTPSEMAALVAEVASRGDADRGEAIFRRAEASCMKCHALTGAGGGVGPELSALGLSSPVDYVINSILIPDQAIKEEYQTRIVLTDDGRVLQGIVVEEDDKRLVLKDATAEIRVVPTSSIEDSKKGGSLMPRGLSTMLTRAEFVDLVRFLSELGKPGPYSIRPIATVQRWRVLKSSPGADPTIAEILQADPGRWIPAYAQVAGSLPLEDVRAAAGGDLAMVQGEVAVSSAGPVAFRFQSPEGLKAWLDDRPIAPGGMAVDLAEGRHKLTLRVDVAARKGKPIRVEVVKGEGSGAEFSVVGGR